MLSLSQARIGQIAIVCEDVARARTFYKDTLGVRHLFDAGPNLAFFESGSVRLMLSPAEGPAKGTSVLYFFVHDIETAARALKARGVHFYRDPHMIAQMPDHELRLSEFRDSEGNVMALMEEKR